ncbi:MAG: hypothetical protein OXB86_05615, partial [Bdellovibrionales bacterium]|nr:hypothetical protein [Bdellovibrionales bacterium]
MIQEFLFLKKNLRKIGILFLCLVFSGEVLAQTAPPPSAAAAASGASGPPPSGPRPPNRWKTAGKQGGAILFEVLAQWGMFQTAIVGHIYREYGTDWMFYHAPKNPDPEEEALKQYGWNALKQFGVFYMASDLATRGVHALADKTKIPRLKGLAGASGMAVGYFISQLYTDAATDQQLLDKCTQDIMSGRVKLDVSEKEFDFLGVRHIPSCQEAYLEWARSGRWQEYGVDLVTMFMASGLSHGLMTVVQGGVNRLRYARTGTASIPTGPAASQVSLARFAMRFVNPVIAFAASFLAFIEINDVLDRTLGNYIKKNWIMMPDISSDLNNLFERFSQLTPQQLSFLTGQVFDTVLNTVNFIHQRKAEEEDYDKRSLFLRYLAKDPEGQKLFSSVLYGLEKKG